MQEKNRSQRPVHTQKSSVVFSKLDGSLWRSSVAIVAALCCLFGVQDNNQLQAQDQPNIIYIFVDDLSSGMVGFTNPNTPVKTPNIDALAAAGIQFTQAYANTICSPSRGSLHTGYHNGHAINDRNVINFRACLLYTSPSPRDQRGSRMPSSA